MYYTEEALKLKYKKIPMGEDKVKLLWRALELSKVYGTYSTWDCVFSAMGFSFTNEQDKETGKTLWARTA